MVPDEAQIIKRAQSGESAAFGELYEAYFVRIFRYLAFKVGRREDAEDLAQAVFIKALESIGTYQSREVPFSSWLFRIAHNQMVDLFRRRNRRPEISLNEEIPLADDCADPHEELEIKLQNEALLAEVKKLSAAQREVIALRFAAEMPIAEVARAMNRSEGAIKALQHSAVASLRRRLGGQV